MHTGRRPRRAAASRGWCGQERSDNTVPLRPQAARGGGGRQDVHQQVNPTEGKPLDKAAREGDEQVHGRAHRLPVWRHRVRQAHAHLEVSVLRDPNQVSMYVAATTECMPIIYFTGSCWNLLYGGGCCGRRPFTRRTEARRPHPSAPGCSSTLVPARHSIPRMEVRLRHASRPYRTSICHRPS